MSIWTYFLHSSTTRTVEQNGDEDIKVTGGDLGTVASDPHPLIMQDAPQTPSYAGPQNPSSFPLNLEETKPSITNNTPPDPVSSNVRRFSFKSFSFSQQQKTILATIQEKEKRVQAAESASERPKKVRVSRSDRRAQQGALHLRSMIIGPSTNASPTVTPAIAMPQLSKLKTQLMEPKSANKLIAQLRLLPATDASVLRDPEINRRAPIHAVCLEHTDAEEDRLHFAKLQGHEGHPGDFTIFANAVSAPVEKLTTMLNDMRVVDLLMAPSLGLGQPGDGNGILAGAVPTAETVIEGVKQITPQLMALGYATGHAILPDHSGIYPPTDRLSVLTYWWGFEVLLPPPTLKYLANTQSITGSIVNFLSALALVNNGASEILPFVRYIAQYIDFEFDSIKRQDNGQGVACAATWIMPAALVPRPWDFPIPPSPEDEKDVDGLPSSSKTASRAENTASSTSPLALTSRRPISSMIDIIVDSPPPRDHIESPYLERTSQSVSVKA